MKATVKRVIHKLAAIQPHETIASVLTPHELELYTQMCASTTRAEAQALPSNRQITGRHL